MAMAVPVKNDVVQALWFLTCSGSILVFYMAYGIALPPFPPPDLLGVAVYVRHVYGAYGRGGHIYMQATKAGEQMNRGWARVNVRGALMVLISPYVNWRGHSAFAHERM